MGQPPLSSFAHARFVDGRPVEEMAVEIDHRIKLADRLRVFGVDPVDIVRGFELPEDSPEFGLWVAYLTRK